MVRVHGPVIQGSVNGSDRAQPHAMDVYVPTLVALGNSALNSLKGAVRLEFKQSPVTLTVPNRKHACVCPPFVRKASDE